MLKPVTSIFIPGLVGVVESVVVIPSINLIKGIVIILHPHPLQGGSNQNKVVQIVLKAAVKQGYIAYAPNFRGVGKSEGVHDYGKGEINDIVMVVKYVQDKHPEQSIVLAGFSFGAYIVTQVIHHCDVKKIILIGTAVGKYKGSTHDLPKNISCLLIHAEKDEIIPIENLFAWARVQNIPVSVILDAAHFFHGKLISLQRLVEEFLH